MRDVLRLRCVAKPGTAAFFRLFATSLVVCALALCARVATAGTLIIESEPAVVAKAPASGATSGGGGAASVPAQGTPASASSAATAAASSVVASPVFSLRRGEVIAEALSGWATAAGWHLDQPVDISYVASGDVVYREDFQQAITKLVEQLHAAGAPLHLHLWPDNRSALIQRTVP